jgi:hypothetical protein
MTTTHIYTSQRHLFTVTQHDEGVYMLRALCGGIGLYAKERLLTSDEVAVLNSNPEELRSVADALCNEP